MDPTKKIMANAAARERCMIAYLILSAAPVL
jgi:hypothetical protein